MEPRTITEPLHTTPTIHSNGTPAGSLKEALAEAYGQAAWVLDRLKECRPNGRDYYLPYGSTLVDAQRQADYRENLIHALRDSLEAEMDRIDAAARGGR